LADPRPSDPGNGPSSRNLQAAVATGALGACVFHQAMTVLEEISSINLELIRLKEPATDP
jgi:hypothetical protein